VFSPGDFDCLAEFARTSSTAAVNDYDDEGQAALHVAADKGLTEAISILTGARSFRRKPWGVLEWEL
jgi:hypothetical protein